MSEDAAEERRRKEAELGAPKLRVKDPAAQPESEEEHVERKAKESDSLDAGTTYEVVKREGLRELDRPTSALMWSGLAAGLSMGFSFVAEGVLHSHLPDAPWRPLVSKLGYSVGFLIVIMGSQQLFTENTLTPIVPLLHEFTAKRLRNVLRLWSAVLLTNLIGAFLFALALGKLPVVSPEAQASLTEIATKALSHDALTTMLHAVYAGWLIALMVWMLPESRMAKPWIIIIMAYLVGIGEFAHVIAGATEVFYAGVRGDAAFGHIIAGWLLPTLAGNVVGGVTMVASLNHAQATSGEGDSS